MNFKNLINDYAFQKRMRFIEKQYGMNMQPKKKNHTFVSAVITGLIAFTIIGGIFYVVGLLIK